MTKQRFTYEYDEYNGNLFDNKMNTFYHIEDSDENIEVLCDRLNWLVEENEQLQIDKKNWYRNDSKIRVELHKLEKENEHIKHTIKTMMETERTELGQSVLRQLWEAIQ